MPLQEFLAVAEGLRPSGYRPVRFRPYVAGGAVQVAAVWTRDGQEWRVAHRLTEEKIRQTHDRHQTQKYQPVDVACYLHGGQECYAALWIKASQPAIANLLEIGLHEEAWRTKEILLSRQGYWRAVSSVLTGLDGKEHFSAVWTKAVQGTLDRDRSFLGLSRIIRERITWITYRSMFRSAKSVLVADPAA
jgi:hypothetical protein